MSAKKIVSNPMHEQDFPSISICPGFKRDRVLELGWPYRYLNKDYNVSDNFEETFPKTRKAKEALV